MIFLVKMILKGQDILAGGVGHISKKGQIFKSDGRGLQRSIL